MSVRQLLAETDSAELSEWMAFYRLEPPENGYWQAGIIASTFVGVMTGKRTKPEDFMPQPSPAAAEEQSAAEGIALMKRLAAVSRAKGTE